MQSMKWIDVEKQLPGFGVEVFVYCIQNKSIAGPVALGDAKKITTNGGPLLVDGKPLLPPAELGHLFAWIRRHGVLFTDFQPTHWIKVPNVPEPSVNG